MGLADLGPRILGAGALGRVIVVCMVVRRARVAAAPCGACGALLRLAAHCCAGRRGACGAQRRPAAPGGALWRPAAPGGALGYPIDVQINKSKSTKLLVYGKTYKHK